MVSMCTYCTKCWLCIHYVVQVKSKDFVDRARVPPTVVQIVVLVLCIVGKIYVEL